MLTNEPGDRLAIAIGGELGSGKSTLARVLAAELGMPSYSTGDLHRRMAAELGITNLELNRRAETDPQIDRTIDSSTLEVAAREPRVLLDSRLAWHFVPYSFKVFLTVDPTIGAQRILNAGRGPVEEYESLEDALRQVQDRRESEDRRYAELYGLNPERLDQYDLVLDTSYAGPQEAAAKVQEALAARQIGSDFPTLWLSPRTPLPTGSPECGRPLGGSLPLLRVGRYYYRYREHESDFGPTGPQQLSPARLVASDADLAPSGETARRYVERECTAERIRSWEEETGLRFPSLPPHLEAARRTAS